MYFSMFFMPFFSEVDLKLIHLFLSQGEVSSRPRTKLMEWMHI